MTTPALKPSFMVQASDDLGQTAFVQLSLPDGKFVNFSIDRDAAYALAFDLMYHIHRQEKAIADAPKNPDNTHS